jgi:DNA-directed RNA polymerase
MNLNNGLLISKAKNKYLFIAFALEYIKLHNAISEGKVDHIFTQLPIQLDATCNGYQHLSMLSRDNDLGKDLNLMTSKKDDVPQDFYGLFIRKITNKLQEAVNKSNIEDLSSDIEAYKRIINFNPDRSLIKKPLMIESYNAH